MLSSRNFNLHLSLDRKLTHKVLEFKQKNLLINLKKLFLNQISNNVLVKPFKTLSRKYSMQLSDQMFKSNLKKQKKICPTTYIVLYFEKWNFLALILNIFLYFLTFRETETLIKLLYISGNRILKTIFISQEIVLLSPNWKTKKKPR